MTLVKIASLAPLESAALGTPRETCFYVQSANLIVLRNIHYSLVCTGLMPGHFRHRMNIIGPRFRFVVLGCRVTIILILAYNDEPARLCSMPVLPIPNNRVTATSPTLRPGFTIRVVYRRRILACMTFFNIDLAIPFV